MRSEMAELPRVMAARFVKDYGVDPRHAETLTGTREMDGNALIEYFAPLMDYLAEQNKGLSCGWGAEET